MTTLISGQLGKAAFIHGDTLSVINVDGGIRTFEAPLSGLRPLFGAAQDLQISPLTSEASIRTALRAEWQKDRGLLLTLMILDADLDDDLRDETVPFANELLEIDTVARFVLYMLHARPIGDDVLSEGMKKAPQSSALHSILERTVANNIALTRVSDRWDRLSDELFSSDAARSEARAICVRAGVFYHLANALRSNSSVDLNTARFDAFLSLKSVAGSRDIVARWFGPLKTAVSSDKSYRPQIEAESEGEDVQEELYHKGEKLTPHERYRRVQSQLPGIRKNIQKLRIEVARLYTDQIVKQQVEEGDEEFAAKTLCNVASFANECFQFSFALELTQQATQLYSVDPVSWAMLADAYIRSNRYDEAIAAFRECRRFGRELYAASGVARILRHQNRLMEARTEFEKILETYDNDPEIWNTYLPLGELYRDLGAYDDASSLYEKGIRDFPGQHLLLCSKGALLRELGDLKGSTLTFQKCFDLYGRTVEGSYGLAESLRHEGDLKAAYDVIDKACRRFADQSALYRLKAEILREMGKAADAIAVYEFMEAEFPFDHSGVRGHIDALLKSGGFEKALNRIRSASATFPKEPSLRLKEALVLEKSGHQEAALALLGNLSNEFPTHLGVKIGIAELLKQLGSLDDAKALYEELLKEIPYNEALRVSSAAISVAKGDFAVALSLLPVRQLRTKTEWAGEHVRGMALLRQENVAEALKVFEVGSKDAPFLRQREYFQTALLLAQLRMRRIEEVQPETIVGDDPISNVIKLHAYAMKNQVAQARHSLISLAKCPTSIIPLRDELAAQMKLSTEKPRHGSAWIFAQEVAILALVPTYDLAA